MSRLQNLLLLHLIVILFGFTGILGKLITLDSSALVWYRMSIASAGLIAYLAIRGRLKYVRKAPFLKLAVWGGVVAAHWITFFEAIKISTVSIALATMSSASLFVALFTPFFEKKEFKTYEVVLGLMAISGLVMIFGFESEYVGGIVFALISAALAALFTLGNARLVKTHRATVISTVEIFSGSVILFIYLAATGDVNSAFWDVSAMDWLWLILLGLVATSFAFVVSVEVMKELSPFTVSITINLEPVYSILLALWIFGSDEQMTWGFYVGAFIILMTIFINAWLKARSGKIDRDKIRRIQ